MPIERLPDGPNGEKWWRFSVRPGLILVAGIWLYFLWLWLSK